MCVCVLSCCLAEFLQKPQKRIDACKDEFLERPPCGPPSTVWLQGEPRQVEWRTADSAHSPSFPRSRARPAAARAGCDLACGRAKRSGVGVADEAHQGFCAGSARGALNNVVNIFVFSFRFQNLFALSRHTAQEFLLLPSSQRGA